jgi:pimeloyl-ACP methyl ester carboxylesterase
MITLLTGAAALVLTGAGAQRWAEARDRRRYPAPGRLLRVADVDVHVDVQGQGPAVLIDSGLGGSSIEWARVAADLEDEFTLIRYDRPGFAWSPGSECDRRAQAAATRLISLLRVLDVEGPVILVGHSLGGLHVRVAAALAPELIGGLVLVDPSHEGMLEVIETSTAAAVTRVVLRTVASAAPVGIGRLAGRAFARLALAERQQPLTPAERQGARLSGLLTSRTVHGLRALSAEHAALADSLRQLVELTASESAADIPLTVITAAAPSDNPRVVTARAQIDQLHAELVAASPRGRQVLAERSGHLVPLDQPEIITQSVRETALAMSAGIWAAEGAS